MSGNTPRPLTSRPLDALYLAYFASHIPVTLLMDLSVLLPRAAFPAWMAEIHAVYVEKFRDPFMSYEGSDERWWFKSFVVCELLFQLPFFVFATWCIWRDLPRRLRLPMLVYASHVSTTLIGTLSQLLLSTAVDLDMSSRLILAGVYFPYLAVPLSMLWTAGPRFASWAEGRKERNSGAKLRKEE